MTLPLSSRETELAAQVAQLENELESYRKVGTPEQCRSYKHAFYTALGMVDWDTVMAWKIKKEEVRALKSR